MSTSTGPLMRSRCVIIEMLELRGYDTSNLTFTPISSGKNPDSIKLIKKNESEIQIHYDIMKKTQHKKIYNPDDGSGLIDTIVKGRSSEEKKLDLTIIIILRDKSTPTINNAIQNAMIKYKIFVQIFDIRKLMYNITKHQIVPQHERIYSDELKTLINGKDTKKGLLELLHIQEISKLPHILESDPVAMFIGLRPGEVCKITRPSQSAGVHIVYRYCV